MTGIRIMKDNDNEDGFKNRPKSDYGKILQKIKRNSVKITIKESGVNPCFQTKKPEETSTLNVLVSLPIYS